MIEEVIIAALWYVLTGYFSAAGANKIRDKRLGWWGQSFHGQSPLKVLILPLLSVTHPCLPFCSPSPRKRSNSIHTARCSPWSEKPHNYSGSLQGLFLGSINQWCSTGGARPKSGEAESCGRVLKLWQKVSFLYFCLVYVTHLYTFWHYLIITNA